MRHADKKYDTPEEILKDNTLTEKQKLIALNNLENEQKALMRADDENMTHMRPEDAPSPARALEKIKKAEKQLRHSSRSPSA